MEKIMEQKKVELLIIGGGPAGTAAGVYAARKQLDTTLVTAEYGGQSVVSSDIKNWIGTPSISGHDLAESFKKHLYDHTSGSLNILEAEITAIREEGDAFIAELNNNETVTTQSLLVATGSTRRKLQVPGADTFEHKGLTYCASCDGPLFADKNIVVIGGGNAGFETAAQLLAYAKHVTLLHRSDTYRADAITVAKVLAHPNMTGITNAGIAEVLGDGFVKGIAYEKDGEKHSLEAEGVFVEIGLIPSTGIAQGLVDIDSFNRIIVDPRTQQTSHKRIWAAGDCTDGMFHQNNIAAGDAVKALEHIYFTLRAQ